MCIPVSDNAIVAERDIVAKPFVHHSTECVNQWIYYRNCTKMMKLIFKSPELRAAVETALSSAYDVSTILPSGGWKSLLFFLYAKKYPHMTSIVVVPERNFCAKNINNTAALNQKPLQNSHHKAPLSVFQPVNQ